MSAFLFSVLLAQDSITNDARLAKVIDIDQSLVPIQTFLQNATKATGVSFSASPALKNLKVDVFVDQQPLHLTLQNLAEACGLKWEKGGGGYDLVEDPQLAGEVRSYLSEEDKLADKLLRRKIETYRLVAKLVPVSDEAWRDKTRFDGFKPELVRAELELAKAVKENVPEDQLEGLIVRVEALKEICNVQPNLPMARLFSQMTDVDVQAFRNGSPYLATNSADAQFILSTGDIAPSEMPGRHYLFTYVEPETRRIGFKMLGFRENNMSISGDYAGRYPFDAVPTALEATALMGDLRGWDQTKDMPTLYGKEFDKERVKNASWASPWYDKRFRLGDHLRWFHRATGTPVVAPAFRTIHPFVRLNRKADTQGNYLTSLVTACKGYAHKSGDFLQVRDGAFWRKQKNEISEELLSKFESSGGVHSIDALGSLANKITHLQASLIEDREGFVVNFSRNTFAEGYPAAKFYSSLEDNQVAAAKHSTGLGFSMLTSKQKQLYMQAITRGIADRGWASPDLMNNFSLFGFEMELAAKMAFTVKPLKMKTIYEAEYVTDEGEQIETVPRSDIGSKVWNFRFGSDAIGSIRFLVQGLGMD